MLPFFFLVEISLSLHHDDMLSSSIDNAAYCDIHGDILLIYDILRYHAIIVSFAAYFIEPVRHFILLISIARSRHYSLIVTIFFFFLTRRRRKTARSIVFSLYILPFSSCAAFHWFSLRYCYTRFSSAFDELLRGRQPRHSSPALQYIFPSTLRQGLSFIIVS
jgi:hypothetical protein